jgi:hypothetical protein
MCAFCRRFIKTSYFHIYIVLCVICTDLEVVAKEGNGSGNVDFYGRHYDFTDDLRHRWMTNDMLS